MFRDIHELGKPETDIALRRQSHKAFQAENDAVDDFLSIMRRLTGERCRQDCEDERTEVDPKVQDVQVEPEVVGCGSVDPRVVRFQRAPDVQ